MPQIQNPFLYITPRAEEDIVNMKELMNNLDGYIKNLKNGGIIILSGTYGSGKTLILNHLKRKLSKRKVSIESIDFNLNTKDKIRSIKGKKILMIDRFDLADTLKNDELNELLTSINEISERSVIFIISIIPELITRIFSLNEKFKDKAKIFEVSALGLNETRELIVSRLNEVRKEKSNSTEPFTEDEVKKIWEKAKGNPRMILLLCSTLYDLKMSEI